MDSSKYPYDLKPNGADIADNTSSTCEALNLVPDSSQSHESVPSTALSVTTFDNDQTNLSAISTDVHQEDVTQKASTIHNEKVPSPPVASTSSANQHLKDSVCPPNTANGQQDSDSDSQSTTSSTDSSDVSEKDWKPPRNGAISWVHSRMCEGVQPRQILSTLMPNVQLPGELDESALWHIIVELLTEPPKRKKLPQYNSLDDAVELLRRSNKIMVITGAGVSVSCGIPDFRSKGGIYARLHQDFPDLPDPQAMFDIHYFRKNPRPFYQFAKEIYPGKFQPSRSHKFIRALEMQQKLLRNYTQNIDTLEQVAGISNVVHCHGSFSTASCCSCKHQVDCEDIREDIMNQRIPRCPHCPEETDFPVLKPDIVFFGQDLPRHFHQQMRADRDQVDLLIVMGSSMKVRPVALIPDSIPTEVPQILIDRTPLDHINFDIELLGYSDEIVDELCLRLGTPFTELCSEGRTVPLKETRELPDLNPDALARGRDHLLDRDALQPSTSKDDQEFESGDLGDDEASDGSPPPKRSRSEVSQDAESSVVSSSTVSQPTSDQNTSLSAPPIVTTEAAKTAPDTVHKEAATGQNEIAVNEDTTDQLADVDTATCGQKEGTETSGNDQKRDVKEEVNNEDLKELRAMYKPRLVSIASHMPPDCYFFAPPSRCVFKGAEFFMNLEDSDDEDEGSSVSHESGEEMGDDQDDSRGAEEQLMVLNGDIFGDEIRDAVAAVFKRDVPGNELSSETAPNAVMNGTEKPSDNDHVQKTSVTLVPDQNCAENEDCAETTVSVPVEDIHSGETAQKTD